jgi:hypothetical protein
VEVASKLVTELDAELVAKLKVRVEIQQLKELKVLLIAVHC